MSCWHRGSDVTEVRLDLPYRSQLDAAATGAYDCGQACVLMLALYYGYVGADTTVDTVSRLVSGKTTALQLVDLSARFHVDGERWLVAGPQPTTAVLVGYIDQGHPPILLVDYRSLHLEPHLSTDDQGLHWLVVSGYGEGVFYLHDPLWRPSDRAGRGGAYVSIPADTLVAAMRGACVHHLRAVDTPTYPGRSKLGFHVSGPFRTGYGDLLRAGLAMVKAVGERGALVEAKAVDPRTITAYRVRTPGDTPPEMYVGDPAQAARAWLDALLPLWFAGPIDAIDYFELTNEAAPPDREAMAWFAAFNVAAMEIADTEGIALGVGSFSAGNPPLDTPTLDALLPMIERAERRHVFCLHSYPILGDGSIYHEANRLCLYRFEPLYRFFAARGLNPVIDLTEAGVYYGNHDAFAAGGPPHDWIVQSIRDFDASLRSYPYVRAFAEFDLGAPPGHEWWGANHVPVAPLLAAYLREQNAPHHVA